MVLFVFLSTRLDLHQSKRGVSRNPIEAESGLTENR